MTQYGVDVRKCRQSVVELDRLNKAIVTSLDTLEVDAESSLRSWEDQAKRSYNECKRLWDESAAKMPQLLTQARNALEQILDNIELTERQGQEMWVGRTGKI